MVFRTYDIASALSILSSTFSESGFDLHGHLSTTAFSLMRSKGLSNSFKAASCLLLAVCWAHVLIVPFTKVEESFTLHAVHDLLHYGPAENITKVSSLFIRVCASLMLNYGSMITLNTRVQFHALSLELCC